LIKCFEKHFQLFVKCFEQCLLYFKPVIFTIILTLTIVTKVKIAVKTKVEKMVKIAAILQASRFKVKPLS
jgi:hypothetical protein